MKTLNFKEIEKDEILECMNCNYTDVAKRWKGEEGNCPECGSRAFKIYSAPLVPYITSYPSSSHTPFKPWFENGGTCSELTTTAGEMPIGVFPNNSTYSVPIVDENGNPTGSTTLVTLTNDNNVNGYTFQGVSNGKE